MPKGSREVRLTFERVGASRLREPDAVDYWGLWWVKERIEAESGPLIPSRLLG